MQILPGVELAKFVGPEIDIRMLFANLLVGTLVSLVLRWHFIRFGKSQGARSAFAKNFTLIILTIIVMISLVKNSVAISLGLVGALSLVRFRTPIKDPEELVYLLLAVVVGTGLGAGATFGTVVATAVILLLTAIVAPIGRQVENASVSAGMYLSVSQGGLNLPSVDEIFDVVSQVSPATILQRFELGEGRLEAIFFVQTKEARELSDLASRLASVYPGISVSAVGAQAFESGN